MKFLEGLLSQETITKLKGLIGDELIKKIDELTTDFKIDPTNEKFIPKSKFDEINVSLKDVKKTLDERDTQIESLKKSAAGNADLEAKIKKMQDENAQAKLDYEAKLLAREKDYALDSALIQAKAKNLKSVKANLDMEQIIYKDGKLSGVEEQIRALKETDNYLFDIDSTKDTAGKDPKQKGAMPENDRFARFRKLT